MYKDEQCTYLLELIIYSALYRLLSALYLTSKPRVEGVAVGGREGSFPRAVRDHCGCFVSCVDNTSALDPTAM